MAFKAHCNNGQLGDYELGQELAARVAQQASSNLPYSIVFNQLQDLLGDDTALLAPLRDLLGRPDFKQIVRSQRNTTPVGARDALLQELGVTYNSQVLKRLGMILNGCLGLPSTPLSPKPQKDIQKPFAPSLSTPKSSTQTSALKTTSNRTACAAQQTDSRGCRNSNRMRSGLIAMATLLSGAVVVAIGIDALRPKLKQAKPLKASQAPPLISSETEGPIENARNQIDEQSSPLADNSLANLRPDPQPSDHAKPLISDAPTEAELQALVQGWLDAKALTLSGQPADLSIVVREPLAERVERERAIDAAAGQSKSIDASITTIEVVDRKPRRIELLAQVVYSDRILDGDSAVIDATPPTNLIVTYILWRDGSKWRVHDYIPGS